MNIATAQTRLALTAAVTEERFFERPSGT